MTCDNKKIAHSPVIVGEDNSAIRTTCTQCGQTERIGKDLNGNPEHRAYGRVFKKDVLQPGYPLYYKYNHKGMRVV